MFLLSIKMKLAALLIIVYKGLTFEIKKYVSITKLIEGSIIFPLFLFLWLIVLHALCLPDRWYKLVIILWIDGL